MQKRLFKLSPRLQVAADMVRDGVKIVDVGTDHAYLAIWLSKMGRICNAIASDLREGPLLNAESNIKKYQVEKIVQTRLSNGLLNIKESEADDIIIAGMGGEIIINIINDAKWLKNTDKRLILQPMSAIKELRIFLKEEGYEIEKEQAVISENKIYTVMQVCYKGHFTINSEKLYPYVGRLNKNVDEACIKYMEREIRDLNNKIKGCMQKENQKEANDLQLIINEIKQLITDNNSSLKRL